MCSVPITANCQEDMALFTWNNCCKETRAGVCSNWVFAGERLIDLFKLSIIAK